MNPGCHSTSHIPVPLNAVYPLTCGGVGEATSGYLAPGWKWPEPHWTPGWAAGSPSPSYRKPRSLSEEMPFSLSVWLTRPGREAAQGCFGEAPSAWALLEPADLLLMLESMLLVLDLFRPRSGWWTYWALADSGTVSSSGAERQIPIVLILSPIHARLPAGGPTSKKCGRLWDFASVADLLVTVAPLAVITARPAAEPLLLEPKAVGIGSGRPGAAGRGFLDSSPLLRPAS